MPISEFIVKQKSEGAVLYKKIAAIVGYFALAGILCLLILALAPPLFYLPFFLMAIAFVAIVVFVTWKFLSIEFEIFIGNGELCVSTIYGRSITRRLLCISIGELSEIGIYDDDAYEHLCAASLQKNYVCVSSMSTPVMYYATFDEGKDHCVLYFETDERGISILKQQNPTAARAGKLK